MIRPASSSLQKSKQMVDIEPGWRMRLSACTRRSDIMWTGNTSQRLLTTWTRRCAGNPDRRPSDVQRRAIEHVKGLGRIAVVVGLAGAGKSTMLAAAARAWERHGYTVHGAALSGKAAEGLEDSSGIKRRTLALWPRGWENDSQHLGRGDVFVIDEAGMVGSRQLASFVGKAEKRGAKIVLVGDHEQLQAIGAGAAFRAIAQQIGHASLGEIKRQMEPWQQEASVAFASHRTAEGFGSLSRPRQHPLQRRSRRSAGSGGAGLSCRPGAASRCQPCRRGATSCGCAWDQRGDPLRASGAG